MQKITAKFFRSGMQRCIAKYALPLACSLFSACARQAKHEFDFKKIKDAVTVIAVWTSNMPAAKGAVRGALGWGLYPHPTTPQTTAGTTADTTADTTATTAATAARTTTAGSILSMEDGEGEEDGSSAMDYNDYLRYLQEKKIGDNMQNILSRIDKYNATSTASPGGAGKKVLYIDSFPIGLHHVTFGGKCMQVAGAGEGTQSTSVALVPGSDARVNKLDGLDLASLTPACAGLLQDIGEELCDGQPQGAKSFIRCGYDRLIRQLFGGIIREEHKPQTREPEDASNPKLPKQRLREVCNQVVGCSAPAKERGREQNRGSGSSTTESSAKSNKRPSNHRALPQQLPDQSRPTRAASANETATPRSTTPTPKKKKRKKKKLVLVENGVYGDGNKLKLTASKENSDLPGTDVEVQGVGSVQGDDNEITVDLTNGATPAVGNPAVFGALALATAATAATAAATTAYTAG